MGRWVLVVLLLGTGTADAQVETTFENLTVDATAGGVGLATATHTPTGGAPQMVYCVGKLETAQIRMRVDGTAPSTTVGTLLDIGDIVEITRARYLRSARFIRTGATSGAIQFSCFAEVP